ncbi:MAG: hypothetical protein R2755_01900 [Acidimicrobiales bacterium]
MTTVIERLEAERRPAGPATSSSAAVVQPTTFEGCAPCVRCAPDPLAPFRRGTSPRPPPCDPDRPAPSTPGRTGVARSAGGVAPPC